MDKEETKHNRDSVEFTNPHPPPAYEHLPPVNQYAPSPNYGQANIGYSGPTVVHTMQGSSSGPHMTGTIGSVGVVGTNMVPVMVVRPPLGPLGPKASTVTCYYCKEQILTRVENNVGAKTHVLAGSLCILGCLPCVPIPYCLDSCKNSAHYCPLCNAYIGP